MKPLSLLFLLLALPALSFCQSIESPKIGSAEDHSTTITKIEYSKTFTCIHFKHKFSVKGNWIQLNKSMYLQDADSEERYAYVKSEGIPLRPLKHEASTDTEEMAFKVYFEPLKPGTKRINIIERALSPRERMEGTTYFNFYDVSLENSWPEHKITDVRLMPPDTASSNYPGMFSGANSMFGNMYKSMLDEQIKFYTDSANIEKIAKATKGYYDALMKAGFGSDQALKIITSKQLISSGIGGN